MDLSAKVIPIMHLGMLHASWDAPSIRYSDVGGEGGDAASLL